MNNDIWSTRFRSSSPEVDQDDESGKITNVDALLRAVADTGFSRLAFELDLDSREGGARCVQTPFTIASQRAAMGIGSEGNEKSRGNVRPADAATRKEIETQSKTFGGPARPIAKAKRAPNIVSSTPMTNSTTGKKPQTTNIKTSEPSTKRPFPFPTTTFAPSPPRKLKKSENSGWTDHKGRPIPKDPPKRTSVLDDIAKKDEKAEKAAKKREAAKRSREKAKEKKEKEKQEQQLLKFSRLPQDVDDTPLGKGFERQRRLPVKDKSDKSKGKGQGKKKDEEVEEFSPPPSTHVSRETAEQLTKGETKKAPTFKRPLDNADQIQKLRAILIKDMKAPDQGSRSGSVSQDEIMDGPELPPKDWNQCLYLTAAESCTTEAERDEAFKVSTFPGPMRRSDFSNAPNSPRSDPSTITQLPSSAFRDDSSSSGLPYSSPLEDHTSQRISKRDKLLMENQTKRAKEAEDRRKRVGKASPPCLYHPTPAWSRGNNQEEGRITPSPSPIPKGTDIEEWDTIQRSKRPIQRQKNRQGHLDPKVNSRFSALDHNNNKDDSSSSNIQKSRPKFVKASKSLFTPTPPVSVSVPEDRPEVSVKEGYTIQTNKGSRYGAIGDENHRRSFSRSCSPTPLSLGHNGGRTWSRDQLQGSYQSFTNQPYARTNDVNASNPYYEHNSQAPTRSTNAVNEDTDEDRVRRRREWELAYQQNVTKRRYVPPLTQPLPRAQQAYDDDNPIDRFDTQDYNYARSQSQTYRYDQAKAQDGRRPLFRNGDGNEHEAIYY